MSRSTETELMQHRCRAFTLTELLVSITVLTVIVLLVSSMVNSATKVATLGTKQIDADGQVRLALDRMAVDFSQMIKRPDVDYYVKSALDPEIGNDKIAFFSAVPGYYPATGSQSPISLVAYRVNADSSSPSFNRMERMGKGLLWTGVSTTITPMVFGLQAIANRWAAATNNTDADPDYELVGSQILRFEYFYLLKTGAVSNLPGAAGLQDVAAIGVALAAIDARSRVLLSDSQLTTLVNRLQDFDPAQPASNLTASWQTSLNGITDMPRQAVSSVRIYQRVFSLSPLK